MQTTYTYGILPSEADFNSAYENAVTGRYRITLGRSDARTLEGFSLGEGSYTAPELWKCLLEIVNETPDAIRVDTSEYGEGEDAQTVYQFFYDEALWNSFYREHYQSRDGFVELGENYTPDLIAWADKFSSEAITTEARAVECLNYAVAYGTIGKDYARIDAALDIVSGILTTLGFEWV